MTDRTMPHPPSPPPTGAKVGLQREQAVRADAAGIAAQLLGDRTASSPAALARDLIDLAEPLVDWIRTGQRPS